MKLGTLLSATLLALLLLDSGTAAQSFGSPQRIPPGQGARPPRRPATTRIVSGLTRPTFATHAPGDATRLFVTEQWTARVRIIDLGSGTVLPTPFLDINPLVTGSGNERGLLGLAFHPDYASNGLFYVHYSRTSDGDGVISEFQVTGDPNVADPGSERIVLIVNQPQTNHNGGWIGFSPLDEYLYIALGDGGNFCDTGTGHTAGIGNAQDLTGNLLGKMLRIDPVGSPYVVPPSNPFVGITGLDEIWAYGLRNPWRASFDRLTGDLWIGDVGQDNREEIDFQPGASPGGENYGWRCMEGNGCPTGGQSNCPGTTGCNCPAPTIGLTAPIRDYNHLPPPSPTSFVCSVTGGYVYRGSEVPFLAGRYLYADYCGNAIWSIREQAGAQADFLDLTANLTPSIEGFAVGSIVSFGEDAAGEVYVVDQGGEIFRIIEKP
jgi:glucose/arabinose dehydrogenase